MAKDPLEYKIRLDSDRSEHVVTSDCLEPTVLDEDREGGILTVNDCMYCHDHRLEVCGECGEDHRMTNFGNELSNDLWSFDVVEKLIDDLSRLGVRGRRAPTKKSKSSHGCPANTAAFRPSVNEKLVALNVNSFDPRSQCELWQSNAPTETALRVHSNFPSTGIPESAKLPVRRLRESIVVAGRQWDRFFREMPRNEPMMRLMLQDEAQTQVISLDLVPPIRSMQLENGKTVPIFVVRWAQVFAASMEHSFAVIGTMERNTKMGEIPVEVDEMVLMAALLKENSKRLEPAFVRSVSKHQNLLSVSFLTSISEEMQTAFYASLDSYCFQCGTSGVTTQKCGRCHVASYCSRECQKKHWKYHKLNGCKSG